MKYLILVGDGMADWPLETHENHTPLELAHTPNMDWLAARGQMMRFQTVPEGCPASSDVANMSIMGYNPLTDLTGRGPLEALSAGVPMSSTDLAFRCNIITIEEEKIKDYSSGHITTPEGKELMVALQTRLGEPGVDFFPGVQYRHILRLDGCRFSDQVICTPPHDQLGQPYRPFLVKPKDPEDPKAVFTAKFLNNLIEKSAPLLAAHPVNQSRIQNHKLPATHIWPWSGGIRPAIEPFHQKYGKTGAVISAVDLIFGIGAAAGLEIIHVPGATGLLDTNYTGKIQAALLALQQKDFVYVHVEAPDEMGHAGDLAKKIQAIEDFDKFIVGPALDAARSGFPDGIKICVLPDHPTPLKIRTHARDPIPLVVFNSKRHMTRIPQERRFTEKAALTVSDPIIKSGRDFMAWFLSEN